MPKVCRHCLKTGSVSTQTWSSKVTESYLFYHSQCDVWGKVCIHVLREWKWLQISGHKTTKHGNSSHLSRATNKKIKPFHAKYLYSRLSSPRGLWRDTLHNPVTFVCSQLWGDRVGVNMIPFWLQLSPAGGGLQNQGHIYSRRLFLHRTVLIWKMSTAINSLCWWIPLSLENPPSYLHAGINCPASSESQRSQSSLLFFSSVIYTTAGFFFFVPCDQLSISNNRPSTLPRGLQHAILKISISAE